MPSHDYSLYVLFRLQHNNFCLQACAYDTVGWGVDFDGSPGGPSSSSAQWPTYFTADLICSHGSSCTCKPSTQVVFALHIFPLLVAMRTIIATEGW